MNISFRRVLIPIGIAAIIIIAAVIIGVKCYKAYTAQKSLNEKLVKDHTEALNQKDTEIAGLKTANVILKKANTDLKTANVDLSKIKKSNDNLQTKNSDLTKINLNLVNEKDKLSQENGKLKTANESLRTQLSAANTKTTNLVSEKLGTKSAPTNSTSKKSVNNYNVSTANPNATAGNKGKK